MRATNTLSILFVSDTTRHDRPYLDPSTRYRSHNIAGALAKRGHRTAVMAQANFEKNASLARDFDLIAFHRPRLTESMVNFLWENDQSPRLIADFDDAIFQVEDTALTPSYRFRDNSLKAVARNIAATAEACEFFANFSASTTPLIDELTETYGPRKAAVIPNALDPAYLGIARQVRAEMRSRSRPYRYGYFPGTATHDADFAEIAGSIAKAMEEDRSTRLLVVGNVAIPQRLRIFSDRIDRHGIVPFHQLPFLMCLVDVVVAPLEINRFTLAKSGLKFFEAAVLGCVTAATPIPDITRFSSPLLRLCRDSDDWTDALIAPLPSERERSAAAKEVENSVTTDSSATLWLNAFWGKL